MEFYRKLLLATEVRKIQPLNLCLLQKSEPKVFQNSCVIGTDTILNLSDIGLYVCLKIN